MSPVGRAGARPEPPGSGPWPIGPVRWIFEDEAAASDAVHRKAEDRPRTGCTWANPTTQRGAVAVVADPRRSAGQGLGPDPGLLRVGNCSGFYGDRFDAMQEMLTGGPLDVLTGDYLAELTMLI